MNVWWSQAWLKSSMVVCWMGGIIKSYLCSYEKYIGINYYTFPRGYSRNTECMGGSGSTYNFLSMGIMDKWGNLIMVRYLFIRWVMGILKKCLPFLQCDYFWNSPKFTISSLSNLNEYLFSMLLANYMHVRMYMIRDDIYHYHMIIITIST